MLLMPINVNEPAQFTRKAWYTGSDAIVKGQGLCFDMDYGTATSKDFSRGNRVEKPTTSNNLFFAGVAAASYAAVSGGQCIDILMPGSVCEIAALVTTTVGSTRLTAIAGSGNGGYFGEAGLPGIGTAVALQTTAVIAADTDLSDGIFFSSLDGSATYTTASKTVTKTGAFANLPNGITSADRIYVHILGGATTDTAVNQITQGRYLVASKTSDDAVVLVESAGANDCDIAFVAVRGNPTVLAKLEGAPIGGTQSGLVEWVSPDSANTAQSLMVGGTTIVFGGVDIDAECGGTLADGSFPGLLKRFVLKAAVTTSAFAVVVTTGAVVDASQASMTLGYSADTLAKVSLTSAGEAVVLYWGGNAWTAVNWTATAGLIT